MNALYNANIKDDDSLGLASSAFPEAKSSKTGASVSYCQDPDKEWFVLRIKYGKVQEVADSIIEDGAYVYLAKVWKDVRNKETGKRQRKLLPFMNLLFAHVTREEAEKYVKDAPESRFTTYYYNHFKTDGEGRNPPLTVRPSDMKSFVRVTAPQDEHVMEVDIKACNFTSNERVRVTFGPFEGVEGRVARIARQQRVVVYINGMDTGIATAYIPACFLEKI